MLENNLIEIKNESLNPFFLLDKELGFFFISRIQEFQSTNVIV